MYYSDLLGAQGTVEDHAVRSMVLPPVFSEIALTWEGHID